MTVSQKILTVSELTFEIKGRLEKAYPYICVKGEISNFKAQSSGHLYFTLKDERAQISAAFFKGNAKTLTRMPKSGDSVIVQGELSVYPPRGNYQLIVRSLQFEGVGDLLLKFHELKEKLQQRGWFDKQHKKTLPSFPKTIGVITSPTGSVIQDILHVLSRRFSGFHLILNPVKVQGEGSAAEITRAIEEMNQHSLADLLIVGRGGGSMEDLWAFNEESVAAAIFHSKIPIISAVGHETDVTLSDYVADVRAPTPSAAAEIAMAEKDAQVKNLTKTRSRLQQTLRAMLSHARLRIKSLASHPTFASPTHHLSSHSQKIDEISTDIEMRVLSALSEQKLRLFSAKRELQALNPTHQLSIWRSKFETASIHIKRSMEQQCARRKERLAQLSAHLQSIDPRNLLTKGYSVLFSEKKDSVILSVRDLEKEQKVSVLMHDGEFDATVDNIKFKE